MVPAMMGFRGLSPRSTSKAALDITMFRLSIRFLRSFRPLPETTSGPAAMRQRTAEPRMSICGSSMHGTRTFTCGATKEPSSQRRVRMVRITTTTGASSELPFEPGGVRRPDFSFSCSSFRRGWSSVRYLMVNFTTSSPEDLKATRSVLCACFRKNSCGWPRIFTSSSIPALQWTPSCSKAEVAATQTGSSGSATICPSFFP
mmetsp:Transcript_46354/g.108621  ORF Transcript_46354/g.108621 Transcript_46354/m.108621 type:complete len:202 (-) Transcript_46354:677-1282(-)